MRPLARRRLACAVAAAAVLIAGCGATHTQRQAVANYVKRVQRVENAMQRPLAQIGLAGNALRRISGTNRRGQPSLASTERSLAAAERQLAGLRARLAAIEVPAPARRLRALTLRLADRQLALTRELGRLEVYLPALASALQPVGPASRVLAAALGVRGHYTLTQLDAVDSHKAAALQRFGAVLDSITVALAKLHPPAVSLPGYRTQIASLRGMVAAAGRLATALTTRSAGGTAALVQFDRAATLNRTVGAQKAQIAAIEEYDAEVAGLRKLVTDIYSERSRLDNEVSND